ncbi:hypothetical protein [Pseudomonas sp. NFIX28]|jgi:hypothetical protein|nr:hypothetical protein [Pseudomonas sp. NFIX28]SDZ32017.1 hypothetical protein SAMN03159453_03234 [Pseudomonas sp. NFIX28]
MRIIKVLLLPLLLILSLIGVDRLHGPRPAPSLMVPLGPVR